MCHSLFFQTGAALLPKLRAHFAEFLNASSLVRLRLLILPTCVGFRYGLTSRNQELFPGTLITSASVTLSVSSLLQLISGLLLTRPSATHCFDRDNRRPAGFHLMRHSIKLNKYWIINQFPIDYDFRPRLRGRLTQGRLPLPWKP